MSQRHTTHLEDTKNICALKIKNAKPDDSGFYSVVVENPYGSDDSTAQVIVVSPEEEKRPRHTSQPSAMPSYHRRPSEQDVEPVLKPPRIVKHIQPETTINEGQPIILNCMIEGFPLPKLSYFKNDQMLPASSRIKTSFNPNTGVCTIRLDDTNVYDAGSYKVRAENPAGRAETAGIVYINKAAVIDTRPVIDPEAFKYLPQPQQPYQAHPVAPKREPDNEIPVHEYTAPNFIIGLPANYKLHEGEPIKLNCQVEGNPKPSINWLKDGKSLPASLRFNTNYVIPTGVASLIVTGALLTDCGNYTAVAENPAGKAYTTSQVFVKESPGIDTQPITNPDAFKYLNRPKYESPDDSQTDDDVPLNRAKPPKVIHGLPNLKQLEGEPVSMACKIDGFPKPTVNYYFLFILFRFQILFY
jgi:hypothetical protein